jgi:hypothetical protein
VLTTRQHANVLPNRDSNLRRRRTSGLGALPRQRGFADDDLLEHAVTARGVAARASADDDATTGSAADRHDVTARASPADEHEPAPDASATDLRSRDGVQARSVPLLR